MPSSSPASSRGSPRQVCRCRGPLTSRSSRSTRSSTLSSQRRTTGRGLQRRDPALPRIAKRSDIRRSGSFRNTGPSDVLDVRQDAPGGILRADVTEAVRVALVTGATRGAGRAIAIVLGRADFYVYATGRSSRTTGPSEIGRPETIEETGDLIAAAGGGGTALVVEHEDRASVAELVAGIEREQGRLDLLVNDIFGGDRCMAWDKTPWAHDTAA